MVSVPLWQFSPTMTLPRHADLLLTNALALTMEQGCPRASWVAVGEGRILTSGGGEEWRDVQGPDTRVVDCAGMTLLPGFVDAHCHLLALASSLRAVNCRAAGASSVARIVELLRVRAEATEPGDWVRGFGYDEFYLADGRHPTRLDLDGATTGHPVRLDHRTGHASVLNSLGLDAAGIRRDTPDPPEGIIERDGTGEPTGVLFEMSEHLRLALRHPNSATSDETVFLDGAKAADRLLRSSGVTSIHDASPGNGLDRWRTFGDLKEGGHLASRVVMMAGSGHWESFQRSGMATGDGDDGLRLGAVKVMLSLATGALLPSDSELRELAEGPHRAGYQLAFHAVEYEAVEAAADTIMYLRERWPRHDARHRIEHCSECPPSTLAKVQRSGALVVTQPVFTHQYGDRYLSLTEDNLRPHLYPLRALQQALVPLAAGSDAPVATPDPLLGIYSAVSRETVLGTHFDTGRPQQIAAASALSMHTSGGAYAGFQEHSTGSIAPGKLADLVLLDRDPTSVEPEALKETRVVMTLVGGRTVWEG